MNSFSVRRTLYNLGIRTYNLAIHLAYPFHEKARLWVNGRRGLLHQIASWRKQHHGKICWFHAASLGEFEMALPLMQRLKAEDPGMKILLTFFSPSGFEVRKQHPLPDGIFYLPPDTPENAAYWARIVRPDAAVFIKYEIWLNYLFELQKAGIPVFLVNAVFKRNQRFFKKNSLFLEGLKTFRHICVQYSDSEKLLNEFGIHSVSTTGDLRFDRVRQIASAKTPVPLLSGFKGNSKLIIGGSTWQQEEELLSEALHACPDWKLALFPHEFKGKRKKALMQVFEAHNPVFWSENQAYTGKSRVYIIDTIGLLSSAYQYAELAMVGGGFSGKLHNILEPLAFGVPVISGPKTWRFEEAQHFESQGWVRRIENSTDLTMAMQNFRKPPQSDHPEMPEHVTEQVWQQIKEGITKKA